MELANSLRAQLAERFSLLDTRVKTNEREQDDLLNDLMF